jgi:HD-GYP domain-containing protein (c-di-GMP phosphodiesterase class II)
MRDHKDVVIGVVQLINKKRDRDAVLRPVTVVDEQVIPFTAVDEELVTSLASQAAVAYENTLLIQNIKDLFDSFVRASVTTIEKRDPTTSGHSERVAELTVGLAEKVDGISSGPLRDIRFTRDEIQQIRYASLLHDFGKVGVPEKYLLKKEKLYGSNLQLVEQRFEYIQRTQEVEHLKAKIRQMEAGASRELLEQEERAFEARREEITQLRQMIREANQPSILKESVRGAVVELDKRVYLDLEGKAQPFLTPKEVHALSVTKGSLTADEREHINEHVQHTYEFLNALPWTSELKKVPEIAWKHHATLDGTGYPRMEVDGKRVQRWKADEIPVQARMMTICDIYDALTAKDRPYKVAIPVERALDILRKEEAGRGRIDPTLLETFIEAKVYELTLSKIGAKAIGRAPSQPPAVVAEHAPPKVAEAGEQTLKAGAKVS